MDFLAEGFRRAWDLLIAGDSEVYGIALVTLKVADVPHDRLPQTLRPRVVKMLDVREV